MVPFCNRSKILNTLQVAYSKLLGACARSAQWAHSACLEFTLASLWMNLLLKRGSKARITIECFFEGLLEQTQVLASWDVSQLAVLHRHRF